jgi:hypothetical protein
VKERVIFLDFDGVLHPFGCGTENLFNRMPLIHRVLEQNASLRVVVHSSWREIHDDDELAHFLFSTRPDLANRFLGCTPREYMSRWESIEAWVSKHNPEGPVCILDDEPRMFPSHVAKGQDTQFRFVECPSNQGLREQSLAWDKLRAWIYPHLERSAS